MHRTDDHTDTTPNTPRYKHRDPQTSEYMDTYLDTYRNTCTNTIQDVIVVRNLLQIAGAFATASQRPSRTRTAKNPRRSGSSEADEEPPAKAAKRAKGDKGDKKSKAPPVKDVAAVAVPLSTVVPSMSHREAGEDLERAHIDGGGLKGVSSYCTHHICICIRITSCCIQMYPTCI